MIGNYKINGTHIRELGFNTLVDSIIKSPAPHIRQVEIPGSSEVFDTTEYGGYITYGRGEIITTIGGKFPKAAWPTKQSEIARLVNGRLCKLVFDRDPGYYYLARAASVETSLTISRVGSIKITWTADPYKYELDDGSQQQEWDPVNLYDGVFREYPETEINGSQIFEIAGRDKPVSLAVEIIDDGSDMWPFSLGNIWISHSDDGATWEDRVNIGPPTVDPDDDEAAAVYDPYVVVPECTFATGTHYVKIECKKCTVQLHYRGGVLY